MLIKQIKQFLKALKQIHSWAACDHELYPQFLEWFASRNDKSELTDGDFDFLKEQFRQRESGIKGTRDDYTQNPTEANKLWIALAKEVAHALEETYVKILFPEVQNTVDFHDLTKLTETDNPDNFYFGSDNRILYRKRSLCEHLMKHGYELSTVQNRAIQSLRPLQIDVLARLKSCQARKLAISGSEPDVIEEFPSFWDMLSAKVFPKLNPRKKIAYDLLAYFSLLLQTYFNLKESKAPIASFKEASSEFFKFLYSYELDYVNSFYGLIIDIDIDGNIRYMLDFLIELNKVQFYNIDAHLIILVKWLYNLSPQFRLVGCKALEPIYASEPHEEPRRISLAADAKTAHDCKLMLLSFFVLELKSFALSLPVAITVWDKENKVIPQVATIYSRFRPLLDKEDNKNELIARYREVKKTTIDTHSSNRGVIGFFTTLFTGQVDSWFEHVRNGTLPSLGVHWYDPELLMYSLMRFHAKDFNTQSLKWQFLDDLIQTYCQQMPLLQKELRVNILFAEFMKNIAPSPEHTVLRSLLNIYREKERYASQFITDCSYYIGNKLHYIDVVRKDTMFYTPASTMKNLKKKISTFHITNVSDLIHKYKEEINNDEEINKDKERANRLMKLLVALDKPILNSDEVLAAEHNMPGRDPLGAQT